MIGYTLQHSVPLTPVKLSPAQSPVSTLIFSYQKTFLPINSLINLDITTPNCLIVQSTHLGVTFFCCFSPFAQIPMNAQHLSI